MVFTDSLTTETHLKLHTILTEALASVLHLLTVTSQSGVMKAPEAAQGQHLIKYPIVTAAVRALGAWLAEDSLTLATEVYKLLPFLVELCTASDPLEEEGDLLKFLLPGLCHMTADDQGRCILLETCFLKIISRYMEKLLPMCEKSRYFVLRPIKSEILLCSLPLPETLPAPR